MTFPSIAHTNMRLDIVVRSERAGDGPIGKRVVMTTTHCFQNTVTGSQLLAGLERRQRRASSWLWSEREDEDEEVRKL